MTDLQASPVDHPAEAQSDSGGRQRLGRTGWLRLGGLIASVLLVAAAGLLVPMPFVVTSPGSATPVAPLLAVDAATTELTGDLDLLTVRVDQPGLFATTWGWLDDARTLTDRETVIPPDVDNASYFAAQRETFRLSFRVAAAVGLRAAGMDASIVTAPQVVEVVAGAPSDGVLQPGDVIEAVGGRPLDSADALIAAARGAETGDVIALTIERGDRVLDVEVVVGPVEGLPRPGLGISLQTVGTDVDLPVGVELADQRGIGGPSAGLMTALTIYDLVADEDLARGRTITGTGTIAGDGTVGRVGSIQQKAITAERAGADVLLVPASQAAEARAATGGRLDVVGVDTFDDALAALRG